MRLFFATISFVPDKFLRTITGKLGQRRINKLKERKEFTREFTTKKILLFTCELNTNWSA